VDDAERPGIPGSRLACDDLAHQLAIAKDEQVERLSLTLDVGDREALAAFWCAVLGYRIEWAVASYTSLVPADGDGPKLLLQEVPEVKTAKNRLHLDVHFEDFETQADRMVELGATRISSCVEAVDDVRWIVMQDPEGNEFCVCSFEC